MIDLKFDMTILFKGVIKTLLEMNL